MNKYDERTMYVAAKEVASVIYRKKYIEDKTYMQYLEEKDKKIDLEKEGYLIKTLIYLYEMVKEEEIEVEELENLGYNGKIIDILKEVENIQKNKEEKYILNSEYIEIIKKVEDIIK